MQLTSNCFWTFLGLLMGLSLGPRPINTMQSSSISFLKSWTENLGLSFLLLLILLLNLNKTWSTKMSPVASSILAGEVKSRFVLLAEVIGGLNSLFCFIFIFHDSRVSLSSPKIDSLILSASFFSSCNSFSPTTAIPSTTCRRSVDLLELDIEKRRPALVEAPITTALEYLRLRWVPHFGNGKVKLWNGLGLLGHGDIGSVLSSSSSVPCNAI